MTIRIPTILNNGTKSKYKSQVYAIDFRESAPALANATMYHDDPTASAVGGLSVAVPGELRALEEAHKRWGVLSWERLVLPSARLAEGWEVDRELGRRIQVCNLGHRDRPLHLWT